MVLAVGGALLVASAVAGPSRAATTGPGFGKAQAQILMLDPRSAQLSFGVRFAATVADHRNQVARAQAQSTDYGLIGGALTGDSCSGGEAPLAPEDLPQPFRADSRNPEDLAEKEVSEGPVTQSVQADPSPHARADARLAEATLPGFLSFDGATSTTESGVDPDGVPLVRATVKVGTLDILNGVVRIEGLRWEATNRGDTGPVGKFTIGEASIGGVPIPTQDASAVIEAVNNVLSALGIVITPPKSHLEGDTIFVDPIKLGIAPNQTRDLVAGELLAALQPAREQLFQLLIESDCGAGAYITVIDLLLGSLTGGGSFTAVLGGAQAQLVPATEGAGFDPATRATTPSPGGTTGGAFRPATTTPRATTGATPGRSGPTSGSGEVATDGELVAAASTGTADDHAVPIALAVLLLGALLVEADRRKMRQAGVVASSTAPEAPHG